MLSSLHFKLARTSLGMTQEQVAKKSGVSAATIKNIELINPNGTLSNNMSTLVALTKFYEDSGVEFIDNKDSIGAKVNRAIVKKKFK